MCRTRGSVKLRRFPDIPLFLIFPHVSRKVGAFQVAWQWRIHMQCRRCRKRGFDPGVRKILWRRKWQPTPVFLPGESHGHGSLAGCSLWGCKESETTRGRLQSCSALSRLHPETQKVKISQLDLTLRLPTVPRFTYWVLNQSISLMKNRGKATHFLDFRTCWDWSFNWSRCAMASLASGMVISSGNQWSLPALCSDLGILFCWHKETGQISDQSKGQPTRIMEVRWKGAAEPSQLPRLIRVWSGRLCGH